MDDSVGEALHLQPLQSSSSLACPTIRTVLSAATKRTEAGGIRPLRGYQFTRWVTCCDRCPPINSHCGSTSSPGASLVEMLDIVPVLEVVGAWVEARRLASGAELRAGREVEASDRKRLVGRSIVLDWIERQGESCYRCIYAH
jgi:hypothetical protein